MKKTNDYVDNKALLHAIIAWQEKRVLNPDTPLCNTIGKAILDIANNLSRRWNFSGYTEDWKEQMIGDGVETSVKYIKNFDAVNYSNPHTYITTICFRAFQERIKRERKESVKKYKYFVEEVYDADCADMAVHVDQDFYQDMVNKITEYDNSTLKQNGKQLNNLEPCDECETSLLGLGKIYGKDF